MNSKEKLEVLKHITLGTKEVLFFPYGEGKEPLPLRPISSWEFDQCFYQALRYAPEKIAELVIKLKLKLLDPHRNIDVSDEGYVKLQAFYDSVDYWVVYFSMRDFQDDWFIQPDFNREVIHPKGFYKVLEMDQVHEIADFILNTSHQSKEVLEEVFKDDSGREVAYMYFYLNVPLADIKDMTKLQREYLLTAKGQLRQIEAGKRKQAGYIISGEKMTVKDFLDKIGVGY